ncbi:MAG: hypothetical protein CME68_00260 [Halobacteriovoraceae bacterium]|nr:hypothetical protein [Halobacteriovoraceae bacterium]|tara:strand:+ start:753 stop:1553 length:801 start_codon:yes stop_codon:yes gene_type:complete
MEFGPTLLIKKRHFLEKIIVLILLFSCAKSDYNSLEDSTSGTTYNPVTTNPDLGTWSQINGDWRPTNDSGSSISQNQHYTVSPVFLVSPAAYTNVILSGTVTSSSNVGDDKKIDDVFGWVMGLNNPEGVGENPSNYDFVLIDWKQTDTPNSGEIGNCLARVDGNFSGSGERATYFLQRIDTGSSGKFHVLDTNYGSGKGWVSGASYNFQIIYTESKIKLVIDDDTIFEKSGSFPEGKVGFYMYHLNGVTYSNISITTDFDTSEYFN